MGCHWLMSLTTSRSGFLPSLLLLGMLGGACTPPGAPLAAPSTKQVAAVEVSQQPAVLSTPSSLLPTATPGWSGDPPNVPMTSPGAPTNTPVANLAPPGLSAADRALLGPATASTPAAPRPDSPKPVSIPPTPDISLPDAPVLSRGFAAVDPSARPPVAPTLIPSSGAAPRQPIPTLPPAALTPRPTVSPPYHVVMPGTGDPPPAALMKHSSLIVRGTVRQIAPTRWTTPDGRKPAGYDKAPAFGPVSIYRPLYLVVQEVYMGQPDAREIILLVPGGSYPEGSLTYQDQAFHYEVGDDVVVFLSHQGHYLGDEKMWRIEGKYKIEGDVARQNASERPLSSLIADIKSEVSR